MWWYEEDEELKKMLSSSFVVYLLVRRCFSNFLAVKHSNSWESSCLGCCSFHPVYSVIFPTSSWSSSSPLAFSSCFQNVFLKREMSFDVSNISQLLVLLRTLTFVSLHCPYQTLAILFIFAVAVANLGLISGVAFPFASILVPKYSKLLITLVNVRNFAFLYIQM